MKTRLLATLLASIVLPVLAHGQEMASARQMDQLDLDSTAVTGNRELPRVMYIVPWKDSGLGEPAGRPVNSLLNEVLSPLDREVFLRQVRYFGQLYGSAEAAAAP